MGYETKAIFVSSHSDFKGYCRIEATLEMGKIANNYISDLMDKARNVNRKELESLVKTWEDKHDYIFNAEGNYTEALVKMETDEQQKEVDFLFTLQHDLDRNVPYIFETDHNRQNYTDCYGDLLLVVDLKAFRSAVVKENKMLIAEGQYDARGYRRFNMVLKMIDMFDKKIWGDEPVKVILWGH